ncbi:MAG: DUF1996 domain-containing protein [Acidimicrobiia bacterium]|nr:DUF1996 domain-containing protein [Acidimicrobiia bacterium]
MRFPLALGALLAVALAAAVALAPDHQQRESAHHDHDHHRQEHRHEPVMVVDPPPPVVLGPQGRVPQFVVECGFSHRLPDDPIVHPRRPGVSHEHDFFGATATDAHSTGTSLVIGDTTCADPADTAAYWVPSLLDDGTPVEPIRVVAYYRAGPGVDPTEVRSWPLGLAMLAGDPGAQGPQPLGIVAWHCGNSERLSAEPPGCAERSPLALRLTFPDCWNGRDLDSDDHRGHVSYSADGACPPAHPTPIVQLIMEVQYPVHDDPTSLSLSSGAMHTAHGDVLNGWDPDGLDRQVEQCLHRNLVCGVSSSRHLF